MYTFGGNYNIRTPFSPVFGQGFLSNLSPAQEDYFQMTPDAVFGSYLRGLRQQDASPLFQQYAEKWLPDAWKQYQGAQGEDPTNTENFMSYLNRQQAELAAQYRREMPVRGLTRRTRLLYGR